MRIVDIRETAVPLKSPLANSGFDFSEMTTSVVAVITDVVISEKSMLELASVELSRTDVSRISTIRMGYWLLSY